MPTYLVHGFRWARGAIRIHIALYDIDDAAAEWIVAPASAAALLNSFNTLYSSFLPPSQPPLATAGSPSGRRPRFNDWSTVKLLEQYDPAEETSACQPYAYVADHIVPVTLSADVAAEIEAYDERQRAEGPQILAPGEQGTEGQGWIEKLRDKLQQGASIDWYVVVCGDEEREYPSMAHLSASDATDDTFRSSAAPKAAKGAGLRGLFGKREASASKRDRSIRE